MEGAFAAAHGCEVMLVVGTSGFVHPAASLPIIAKQTGAKLIEVNLDPTPFTPIANHSIQGKAGEILPKLWELIKK
jgi:NAD-dependent deacetylase